MKMTCLACFESFIYTNQPFKEYPYCPHCGSGNTAWFDDNDVMHRNN